MCEKAGIYFYAILGNYFFKTNYRIDNIIKNYFMYINCILYM